MELADIVEQEPILSEDHETVCPLCESTNIRVGLHHHTLVGGDPDPNHHWLECYCRDCEGNFTHEYKRNNHWYTQYNEGVGSFVIKGVANCFEDYVYTCNKCPGYVKRYYMQLDGVTPHESSSISYGVDEDGNWGPHQREFWGCVICDNKIETTKPPVKQEAPRRLNYKVVQEVDEGYVDPSVVESVTKWITTRED